MTLYKLAMRFKLSRVFKLNFLLITAMLLVVILSSCGTTKPTSVSNATETPEAPTAISESESEGGEVIVLLPSATPKLTITPGVVTEVVGKFTEATGLQQKTFLRVSVENWINLLVSIVMALVVGLFLSRLMYYGLEKAVSKTETKYDDIFIKKIRHQISLIFIAIGLQIGTLRLAFMDVIIKQWLNQGYTAIYVVAGTIILWHLLDLLVEWYKAEVEPEKKPNQADTLLILLPRIARSLLITISLIMLLSLYNINVNALLAAVGVVGLAISLAGKDTLSNVISGVMIMLDQPFRVGDRIEIQGLGTWGDVVDIGLRSTRIRTRDNRLVIIPNNSISSDQIVNYTFPDPQYRIQIEIGVGYNQDIELVRQIIIDSVRQVEGVLPDKPVDALYVEMSESTMNFRVRWWIESFIDTRRMFDAVNTALQKALDEAGVEMPFNTYDINIINMPDAGIDGGPDLEG